MSDIFFGNYLDNAAEIFLYHAYTESYCVILSKTPSIQPKIINTSIFVIFETNLIMLFGLCDMVRRNFTWLSTRAR